MNSTDFTKELNQVFSDAQLAKKRRHEKEALKRLQKQGTEDSTSIAQSASSQEKSISSVTFSNFRSQQPQDLVAFDHPVAQSQIFPSNDITTLPAETNQPFYSTQLRDIGNIVRKATDFVNYDEHSNTCYSSPYENE